MDDETRFEVGQLVLHRKFAYRGVIIETNLQFCDTEDWYETVSSPSGKGAQSARQQSVWPPRDAPWYRVLVHGSDRETYVAERHLAAEERGKPIEHPLLGLFFDGFEGMRYVCKRLLN
ncbi:MAG: heat shock protein HspQ [Deltaproteobacteria bacterium]|nr:heat shock protein HspQ [Deltaproteobacteria bacterium]